VSRLAQAFQSARSLEEEYGLSAEATRATRIVPSRVFRKGEPSLSTQIDASLRREVDDELLERLKRKLRIRRQVGRRALATG
jgi:hypothetical protein